MAVVVVQRLKSMGAGGGRGGVLGGGFEAIDCRLDGREANDVARTKRLETTEAGV
jgi:hypothetical protein